jgi:hypothetical protein
MKTPHEMTTISETLNLLQDQGYTEEFIIEDRKVFRKSDRKVYNPEDLAIVRHFRFEGDSDPADMSVIYVIEAADNTRGILIDAFGTYAGYDSIWFSDFLKKIQMKEEN